MKAVRVVIVDDSSTMRRLIRIALENDPRLEVVGEAASAVEARELVKTVSPDVLTLDVEMPGMSGLEFLLRLMRAKPMPVVMFSSVTEAGSEAAVKALSLGAFECVSKPSLGQGRNTLAILPEILVAASQAQVGRLAPIPDETHLNRASCNGWNGKMVLIGASTGGVEALEFIAKNMPGNCPPILITQHMPEQFLINFANRLNRLVTPVVRLAQEGDQPSRGEILIAPGGDTHLVFSDSPTPQLHLLKGPKRTGHRPSVDEMMLSAQKFGDRIVSVLLTGMGADGAEGMLALRKHGANCLAQDKNSCVVFGMPRVAIEKGGVDRVLPLTKLPAEVLDACFSNKSSVAI